MAVCRVYELGLNPRHPRILRSSQTEPQETRVASSNMASDSGIENGRPINYSRAAMLVRWDTDLLWRIVALLRDVGGHVDRADHERGYDPYRGLEAHESEVRLLVSRLSRRLRRDHTSLASNLDDCTNLPVHWPVIAGMILETIAAGPPPAEISLSRDASYLDSAIRHCAAAGHSWIARFLSSGSLAYWQCQRCGKADREVTRLPEPLEYVSGWVETPSTLTAEGRRPPVSGRRWVTDHGSVLIELAPCSTHFVGLPIPGLPEAHNYVDRDENGKVLETYEAERKRHAPYGDHWTLVRFQVADRSLVRFSSHCFEESTYDVPSAKEPRRTVILDHLVCLPKTSYAHE